MDSWLYFAENEIGWDEDYDDESAYAWNEDDVGAGEYAVAGDHWIYYYPEGWVEVGTSSATFDDGGGGDGGGGPTPTWEVSSGTGIADGGEFYGNLGYYDEDSGCEPTNDSTFSGGGVDEDVEDIGSDCYDPSGTFVLYIDDNWGWTVGSYSSYGADYIWYNSDWVDYFSSLVNSEYISPCSLWYGVQSLYYNGQYYWGNDVGMYLGYGYNTATRGNSTVTF